ncbi:MAG: ABC transporter substrate-binding protein [Stomatobaculum sp.]
MKKRILAAACGFAAVLSLMACGGGSTEATTGGAVTSAETAAEKEADSAAGTAASGSADSGKTYRIGVLQYAPHPALDKANEGFVAALDEAGLSYTLDQQNAAGDQSACQTIATKLVNDGDDLILAIATPAAQAVAGQTTEIPVLVTAVTDPAESKLVAANDAPGGNVTGSSDLTPVKEQISLLKEILPEAKSVGILYCSAESNSILQADMAKEACAAAGMEAVELPITASNEIQTVVQSAVGKVDALYTPTDNMVAAGMATVVMVANDNRIPVICGEDGMVQSGGLCTYGIDYYQLGRLCGEQAVKILTEGADPATMPIEYLPVEKCAFSYSEETAELLGLDLSKYVTVQHP